ncbi:MAG: D-Ala-D-Ala carboxypeptidase family metallohydrolase [Rhodospirillales bacterium]
MQRFAGFLFFVTMVICAAPVTAVSAADVFTPSRAAFAVSVDGVEIPFRQMAVFALPGGRLAIRTGVKAEIQAETGRIIRVTPQRFGWVVPRQTGPHTVRVVAAGRSVDLTVIVMRSMDEVKGGVIDGFVVGDYPQKPYKGLAAYERPAGLIEVTPELADLPVSPHFRLGQFLCKQPGGWPKFLVLRTELLIKLERVLEAANARGWKTDTLHVMSGYRTPHYNRSIGNGPNSRHIYGGAADIFIDARPRDNRMDDLDGDGNVTKKDALALYNLIEELEGREKRTWMPGGLGAYGSTSSHGPFIHIDARGFIARWGVAPL